MLGLFFLFVVVSGCYALLLLGGCGVCCVLVFGLVSVWFWLCCLPQAAIFRLFFFVVVSCCPVIWVFLGAVAYFCCGWLLVLRARFPDFRVAVSCSLVGKDPQPIYTCYI